MNQGTVNTFKPNPIKTKTVYIFNWWFCIFVFGCDNIQIHVNSRLEVKVKYICISELDHFVSRTLVRHQAISWTSGQALTMHNKRVIVFHGADIKFPFLFLCRDMVINMNIYLYFLKYIQHDKGYARQIPCHSQSNRQSWMSTLGNGILPGQHPSLNETHNSILNVFVRRLHWFLNSWG